MLDCGSLSQPTITETPCKIGNCGVQITLGTNFHAVPAFT